MQLLGNTVPTHLESATFKPPSLEFSAALLVPLPVMSFEDAEQQGVAGEVAGAGDRALHAWTRGCTNHTKEILVERLLFILFFAGTER